MVTKTLFWTVEATNELNDHLEFISEFSERNAKKVKSAVIEKINTILIYPERYPLDKYRIENKGNFRAFEIYHLRISYKITEKSIYIVRVRSTFQSPMDY